MIIIIYLIVFILEILVIDPALWERGISDKPASTIISGLVVTAIAVVFQFIIPWNWALSSMLLALSIRGSLFDYIFNFFHERKLLYLGENKTDVRKKNLGIMRYFIEAMILAIGLFQYYYFNNTIYEGVNILFDLPRFYAN